MRILHLAESLNFGGLETHVLCLVKELAKLGHQPFVFAMVMSVEFRKELDHLAIEYLVDVSPGEKLTNFIQEKNIQILHGHPAATVHLTASLGTELQKPVAVTYHGMYGWNWACHQTIGKIICISQEVYDKLVQSDPTLIPKLLVIQNGIDPEAFVPLHKPSTGRKILFIGRLDPDKYFSIKVIIKALKKVPDIELLVAGSGPYYDQLKSEAPPWVKCNGYIADMPSIINDADIVIGTGRGVREAMACGKPVIALDAYGYDGLVTPENIQSLEYQNFMGRSGQPLTEENILLDLAKVIDHPATRLSLGNWGRKYAEENYSAAAFALKHLVTYNELINK